MLSPSAESPNRIYSAISVRARCGDLALLVTSKLAIARIAPGAALEAVKVGWGLLGRRCISGPAVQAAVEFDPKPTIASASTARTIKRGMKMTCDLVGNHYKWERNFISELRS